MKKDLNKIYFAKRNAWHKSRQVNNVSPEKWELPAQVISWIFFIIMMAIFMTSCSAFKPYSGSCPTNDKKLFFKPHNKSLRL